MRQILDTQIRRDRRDLDDDFKDDLIGTVSVLHWASIVSLVDLRQGLYTEWAIGKDLMFGVISDGPHTVLPQDVRPGLPDVQAIENQVGFPRYRQYFAEGNDTSSHYANESTSKYYRFRKQKREEESGGKTYFLGLDWKSLVGLIFLAAHKLILDE